MTSTSMRISSKINGRAQLCKEKIQWAPKLVPKFEERDVRRPNSTLQVVNLQEISMDESLKFQLYEILVGYENDQ